ncbi:MAG TPA: hypothetical protein VFN05_05160 [Actinomycetes bacterium]|nr:hypothetical protein [Actinomycetes bacterium]
MDTTTIICRPRGRIGMANWVPDSAAALKADMVELARRFDASDDDTLVLRQEYVEAVIGRPAAA